MDVINNNTVSNYGTINDDCDGVTINNVVEANDNANNNSDNEESGDDDFSSDDENDNENGIADNENF